MERRHGGEGDSGEVTFSSLIMMFGTMGLVQVGAAADPAGGEKRPDLAGAKQTIDVLDVLKQKTAGNLTESESALLDGVLFDLRMRYLEATKSG